MAAAVGKFAAQKMLRKQMGKYEGKKVEQGDDPYFAMIEDPKRPGKFKKVKKQIPDYLSEHDAMILARVRKSAYRLDMCLFNLFGIRFGWEAVIGIIPAAGDAIGLALAYLVFMQCCKIDGGLPSNVKSRMIINIIMDFLVGLVPFLGDIADAAFKCNTKNVRLLERHLDQKYKPNRRDERDYAGVDKAQRRKNRASGIYTRNDPPPATVFEDFSDNEQYGSDPVQRPSASRQPSGRRGGSRRERPEMSQRGTSGRQETGRTRR
ncbi:hypothetical protein KC367_g2499 [Hortaea werneckii]|uniref:DUF4112 domain-containing protein n=2 Tax=Hortaea werneckii TaxID=91943 RepID=A0A3M7FFJ5_HORWE|nr:hypothetical protein KC361_g1563 [Hortaea werneckii]OTA33052.1 hypothetical protein BTJ68_06963 [Hortaea werneckii EXF-2000]KAI6814231.1 hypothetical protein KC358_g11195 [Hortaea werneckii]KAI6824187.1 hypothetical protein KC350_g9065 [Hortaea werneckii]KAI6828187.1 hypothetical protein KC342_g9615 [Hortaea werneckii]